MDDEVGQNRFPAREIVSDRVEQELVRRLLTAIRAARRSGININHVWFKVRLPPRSGGAPCLLIEFDVNSLPSGDSASFDIKAEDWLYNRGQNKTE